MAEWIIRGRFTFNGHAMVEAKTEADALAKFLAGDLEFDNPTAEMVDWDARGKPEKQE